MRNPKLKKLGNFAKFSKPANGDQGEKPKYVIPCSI